MAGSGGKSRARKYQTVEVRKNSVVGQALGISPKGEMRYELGDRYIFRGKEKISRGRAVAIAGSRTVNAMEASVRQRQGGKSAHSPARFKTKEDMFGGAGVDRATARLSSETRGRPRGAPKKKK